MLFCFVFSFSSLFSSRAAAARTDSTSKLDRDKPGVLRVAAASDLRFALDELKKTRINDAPEPQLFSQIEIIYGTSGQFAQQIRAGAPYDLFLSADSSFAEKIETAHLAEGPSFRYGTGRLVLWSRRTSSFDWQPNKGLQMLANDFNGTLAVANPDHAPYGRLAAVALKNAGLIEQLKPRLITAEGVSQAAQFALSAATSAALISESLAMSEAMSKSGHFIKLADAIAPPLEAKGVVIGTSKNKKAARAFRDLILSGAGQNVLKKYGLALKE